jgi:ferredoxin
MAVLKTAEQEVEVADGSDALVAAEQLGLPFACREGACRVCQVEVLEGMDNLTPLTENEMEVGIEDNYRLLCQCKINRGTVKVFLDPYL